MYSRVGREKLGNGGVGVKLQEGDTQALTIGRSATAVKV